MTGHTPKLWSRNGFNLCEIIRIEEGPAPDGKTYTDGRHQIHVATFARIEDAATAERAVNRDHAFDEVVKALGGDNFGSEVYPDYLQPIGWLETLLKECERPEVFKALAGDDPDATHSMLFICRSIVERGRAALAKAGSES